MRLFGSSIFVLLNCFLTACTLSFTNVSTHGTADDVVDSTPTSSTDVRANPNVTLPMNAF